MFNRERGIYPPGQYLIGDDIPCGRYLLQSQDDVFGEVSVYENYRKFKMDEMTMYQSFEDDYFLSLREEGMFIVVNNATMKRM